MKVCVDTPDDFLALVPGVFRAGQIHDTVGWPAQPKPAPSPMMELVVIQGARLALFMAKSVG